MMDQFALQMTATPGRPAAPADSKDMVNLAGVWWRRYFPDPIAI